MTLPPLHRIVLKKPENLRPTTEALKEHGYTPWSFWWEDEIWIQFHARKDADLDFLRPYILPARKASNQERKP